MNRFNQTGRGRLVQPSPVTIEPTKANHDFLHLLETTHTHTHTLTHSCGHTDVFLARNFNLGLIYTIIENNLTVENQPEFQGDLVNTKIINVKTVPSSAFVPKHIRVCSRSFSCTRTGN